MWLKLSREKFIAKLHRRDIASVALKRLEQDLVNQKKEKEILRDFYEELESEQHRRETANLGTLEEEEESEAKF